MRKLLGATALVGIMRGVSRNAQRTLQDPAKMQKLASDASRHVAAAEGKGGIVAATLAPIILMSRMLRAYARREYRAVPWATMGAITAALVYFVMPFDFIPDLLAGFGLVDDLALAAFVMQKVAKDLEDFSRWDVARRDGVTVDGVAVDVVTGAAGTGDGATGDDATGDAVDDTPAVQQDVNPAAIAESDEAIDAIVAAILGKKKDDPA